ncbi:hypothetical protein ACF07T_40330, partial [Streptomyces sp. NPDC015184]|uniref:hypothetical protein n=1 Tax=Streptomyces sp. NPDC015184 TaxID=3364946 RepID=UPI0036FB7C25
GAPAWAPSRKEPARSRQMIRTSGWFRSQDAKSGSCPATQEQGRVGELGGESVRAACMPTRQGRHLLGERPTVAMTVPAHKPASPQVDSYMPACDRTIRQSPLVVAAHP